MRTAHLVNLMKIAALGCLLAAAAYTQQPPRKKKIWTNDDFRPATPVGIEKEPAAGTPPSLAATLAARELKEKIAEKKAVQQGYDDAMLDLRIKLQGQNTAFRRELFERMLGNVQSARRANQVLLLQLEARQAGIVSPKGAVPDK